jgi:DNA-binding response OmpR family regulator
MRLGHTVPGIAIIEDDGLMRALMTEWLVAEGYCVTAASGAPPCETADAVIVDLYMPRRLAAARLQASRTAHPGASIIAVSAQFGPGVRCEGPTARALGVDRVIAKPFGRQALVDAVRSVVGPPVLAT